MPATMPEILSRIPKTRGQRERSEAIAPMELSTHAMIPEYRDRSQFQERGDVFGCRKKCGFRGRMPPCSARNPTWEMQTMSNHKKRSGKTMVISALLALLALGSIPAIAQQVAPRDPAEPAKGKPQP